MRVRIIGRPSALALSADGDERCRDFPEMESCAGTGLGNCRFTWKKNGRTLVVFTVDGPALYDANEIAPRRDGKN